MTPQKYLDVQFNTSIKKGFCKNAVLEPSPSAATAAVAEDAEQFIVMIIAKSGSRYWLTDRRILAEHENEISTLFLYGAVDRVHWMFKDWMQRAIATGDSAQIGRLKSEHFDRLEVELKNDYPNVVLEGLDQSYHPLLSFLQFLSRHNA